MAEGTRTINLVSRSTLDRFDEVHISDCLTLVPILQEDPPADVIDVGSGAGLPGIPLAIVSPSTQVTLLESNGRKARFLERSVEALELDNASVVNLRAETAGQDPSYREQFDCAVARAVAPLPILVELTAPFLRIGGRALFQKSAGIESEIAEAASAAAQLGLGTADVFQVDGSSPSNHVIVCYRKTSATPARLPRRPGIPAKRPLGN